MSNLITGIPSGNNEDLTVHTTELATRLKSSYDEFKTYFNELDTSIRNGLTQSNPTLYVLTKVNDQNSKTYPNKLKEITKNKEILSYLLVKKSIIAEAYDFIKEEFGEYGHNDIVFNAISNKSMIITNCNTYQDGIPQTGYKSLCLESVIAASLATENSILEQKEGDIKINQEKIKVEYLKIFKHILVSQAAVIKIDMDIKIKKLEEDIKKLNEELNEDIEKSDNNQALINIRKEKETELTKISRHKQNFTKNDGTPQNAKERQETAKERNETADLYGKEEDDKKVRDNCVKNAFDATKCTNQDMMTGIEISRKLYEENLKIIETKRNELKTTNENIDKQIQGLSDEIKGKLLEIKQLPKEDALSQLSKLKKEYKKGQMYNEITLMYDLFNNKRTCHGDILNRSNYCDKISKKIKDDLKKISTQYNNSEDIANRSEDIKKFLDLNKPILEEQKFSEIIGQCLDDKFTVSYQGVKDSGISPSLSPAMDLHISLSKIYFAKDEQKKQLTKEFIEKMKKINNNPNDNLLIEGLTEPNKLITLHRLLNEISPIDNVFKIKIGKKDANDDNKVAEFAKAIGYRQDINDIVSIVEEPGISFEKHINYHYKKPIEDKDRIMTDEQAQSIYTNEDKTIVILVNKNPYYNIDDLMIFSKNHPASQQDINQIMHTANKQTRIKILPPKFFRATIKDEKQKIEYKYSFNQKGCVVDVTKKEKPNHDGFGSSKQTTNDIDIDMSEWPNTHIEVITGVVNGNVPHTSGVHMSIDNQKLNKYTPIDNQKLNIHTIDDTIIKETIKEPPVPWESRVGSSKNNTNKNINQIRI